MKVLQVTHRYPPRVGGVETHVAELSRRLVADGHDVTVLTADAGGDVASRDRRKGVRIRRYRGLAPGGAFHVAPGIARAVARADADVVHAHNYHALPMLFAALTADDPLVVTPHYHGRSADRFRDRLLSAYRPAGGWALRRADAVLAVGEWERDRLAEDFGVDARVVANGVDVAAFDGVEVAAEPSPYLLAVGRLEAYKGVQHAIRAMPYLREHRLVVAGDGPYREELERLVDERGLADRVDFRGRVSDRELRRLYAGAAAYVALSSMEAFGVTVGEALAAGTPAVVLAAGGLADWGDRPDCVAVEDPLPAVVAAAVREAASLPAPAAPLPTWDGTTDAVLEVYSELLE